jgi:hypothetical protein
MTTIGTDSRPAYVYDAETDTWVPIGVGPHTHDEYIDRTIINAKGDIIVGTATDAVERLGTGTTGQVLTVDPAAPTGLSWTSILSSTNPVANGTAAVGISTTAARADHVHPTTGLGLTASGLNQFASTTSAQLAGVISDETGSGALVFADSPTLSGTVTAPVIRLTTTSDASLTSTGHAFQVGPDSSANLIIDNNEIMARSNGVAGELSFQFNGGNITLGATTTTTTVTGRINGTHYPWAVSANTVSVPGPSPSGPSSSVAVTFPSGRFSVAPVTTATNRSTINVMASTTSVTSSGFTMNVRHVDNTNFSLAQTCAWIAIQMSSGSAGG